MKGLGYFEVLNAASKWNLSYFSHLATKLSQGNNQWGFGLGALSKQGMRTRC